MSQPLLWKKQEKVQLRFLVKEAGFTLASACESLQCQAQLNFANKNWMLSIFLRKEKGEDQKRNIEKLDKNEGWCERSRKELKIRTRRRMRVRGIERMRGRQEEAQGQTSGWGSEGLDWGWGDMDWGGFHSFWSLSEMTNRSFESLTCLNDCRLITLFLNFPAHPWAVEDGRDAVDAVTSGAH